MTVNELIEFLNKLKKDGKGNYKMINDGYLNEIKIENIIIDEKNMEVVL